MSDSITPMAPIPTPVGGAAPLPPLPLPPQQAEKTATGGAVIRRLEAATETTHERLIKKHLPAWVISGAVNIGLVAILLTLGSRTPDVKATDKILDTSSERRPDEPDQNLTNVDPGIQSNLEAFAPEIKRLDEATVHSAVTDDNLGTPGANDNDVLSLPPPGLNPNDLNGGTPGVDGQAVTGAGGAAGQSFHAFPGRSGATKSQLLREGGGNADSERAVARGLAWLARQQRPDGSWIYDAGRRGEVVAATGMALLPFLAAGETHKNPTGKYTKVVRSGLEFLMRSCPLAGANTGKFATAGDMYAQAIGTLALCEAYGMTRDRALLPAAQAAINYIQRAQGPNGSWGYQSGNAGDTSIVGWQIQALQAARLGKDIVVDKKVIDNAIKFLNIAGAGARKSMYGYNDNSDAKPATALTAVGLLCRYYIDGWGPDNGGMAEGVGGLMKKVPNQIAQSKSTPDMYFYYYATQVVHFFEGDEWRTWNEGARQPDNTRKGGMRDLLIDVQHRRGGAAEGSWDPDPGFIGRECGRLGTTCLCLLTLEVYYRHLPLYKRANNNPETIKILDGAK